MSMINSPYHLGACVIKPDENKVVRDEQEHVLQPKFIELLNCLVNHYPSAVTREELIDNIWDGNHFVGEKALTNAVWHLRKTFKELDPELLYIETIRKTGYRLTLPPTVPAQNDNNAIEIDNSNRFPYALLTFFACVCLLCGAIVVWSLISKFSDSELTTLSVPANSIESVTISPGREIYPAISNDGRYLVYSWRQLGKPANLYLRDLHAPQQPARQLTDTPYTEGRSVFSADASSLFYYRVKDHKQCEIVRLSLHDASSEVLAQCRYEFRTDLDVSKDGKTLVYIAADINDSSEHVSRLKLLDLGSKQLTETTIACQDYCNDIDGSVAFSPDAQRVVVTRNVENDQKAIFIIDVNTGQSQKVTKNFADTRGVDWHPHKDLLAFSVVEAGKRYGYFYDIANKNLINTQIAGMSWPTFSHDGSVYFHQWDLEKVIMRLEIDKNIVSSPFSMLSTHFSSAFAEYNAVQKKLLYVSNESGKSQLWIVNKNSTSRRQLTDFKFINGEIVDPVWSPDGRYILFTVLDKGSSTLYLYDFKANKSQALALPFDFAKKPSWSFDSQSILVSDKQYMYRFDLAGNNLGKVIDAPAKIAKELDSKDIIFSNKTNTLWLKEHATGREVPLVNDIDLARYYSWLYMAENEQEAARIYYFKANLGDYRISYYDLATKQHYDLMVLPERAYSRSSGLTYIPEKHWLVYTGYLSPEIEVKRLPAKYLPL